MQTTIGANLKLIAPPAHIALPEHSSLCATLLESLITLAPKRTLIRAAWNRQSVWPRQVARTYRFGPPGDLINADGSFPFHWLYAGESIITAAWEARFCNNDATRPGTFYIEPEATSALIARFQFERPLRLLDLMGTTASKLGIYDTLNSPNYEWCQWFGCHIDRIIESSQGEVDGMRYPSRRHPGHVAYALSSRCLDRLLAGCITTLSLFKDEPGYEEILQDACRVAPP